MYTAHATSSNNAVPFRNMLESSFQDAATLGVAQRRINAIALDRQRGAPNGVALSDSCPTTLRASYRARLYTAAAPQKPGLLGAPANNASLDKASASPWLAS